MVQNIPPALTLKFFLPMSKVRLSGCLACEADPTLRTQRSALLESLYGSGFDIINGDGDQTITLGNIEAAIEESDAFVFTPGARLEDLFKASSTFVGYQTLDPKLQGKPMVILNSDGSWNRFLDLLQHLHIMGTVRQVPGDLLTAVESTDDVIHALKTAKDNLAKGVIHHVEPAVDLGETAAADTAAFGDANCDAPDFNICVFCSASIKDQAYLDDGYTLGKKLADAKIGCVSGAGRTGVMGAVVKGSSENGGWTAGSNVPHIIALEGLPDGLNCFWPRPDIYTRMEIMIEKSQAFVAFPGGTGTIQEVLALLLLKQNGNPIMKDKPIVIFNRRNEQDIPFFDPFISLLNEAGAGSMFTAVDTLDEILPTIHQLQASA